MVSNRLCSEGPRRCFTNAHVLYHRDFSKAETYLPSMPPSSRPEKSSVMLSDVATVQEGCSVTTWTPRNEEQATQVNSYDCHVPGDQDKEPCDDSSSDSLCDQSDGGWDDPAAPTAWDNSWTGNLNEPVDSWGCGTVWTDSPQPGDPPQEKWRETRLRPGSKSWLHRLSFEKPPHTWSDVKYQDILDLHVLPVATRLEDDDWLDSPLEHIRVDDERLFRLLTRGREVAQKCLWEFLDRNRPEIRRREYPGGWQQVKLEVSALLLSLDTFDLGFRHNDALLAREALFAVVPLRHLTSHWNQHDLGWGRPSPRTVDDHLKNVQKLAVHLYDGDRAAEARRLRDEARQLVEDTVTELEALEPLFDVYEWKYHHEQMFEQIKYAKDMKTPELYQYPYVVFRAAEAWSRRRVSENTEQEEGAVSEPTT